jgi:hypothetical protein
LVGEGQRLTKELATVMQALKDVRRINEKKKETRQRYEGHRRGKREEGRGEKKEQRR